MWQVTAAIALLMILATILITTTINATIDKRREDVIKRKEAGVWLGN